MNIDGTFVDSEIVFYDTQDFVKGMSDTKVPYFVQNKTLGLFLSSVCAKLDVLVRVNESVVLKCPTQSASTSTNWFVPGSVPPISKDSTLYLNTENNRISITGNRRKGEYNLQIFKFQTSDIGLYKCTVSIKKVAYQHEFNLLIGSEYF